MGAKRRTARGHFACLGLALFLGGALACTATISQEASEMVNPFSPRSDQVRAALPLEEFRPTAALGHPMAVTQETLQSVLDDEVEITNLDQFNEGLTRVVSAYAEQDKQFAAKIEITQIGDRHDMGEAIARAFDLISAPLTQLAPVPMPGTDLAAQMTPRDTYVIAARGDILISVSTPMGTAASDIAGRVMALIWSEN